MASHCSALGAKSLPIRRRRSPARRSDAGSVSGRSSRGHRPGPWIGQIGWKAQSRHWSPATAGNVSARTSARGRGQLARAARCARAVVGDAGCSLDDRSVAVGEPAAAPARRRRTARPRDPARALDRAVVDGELVEPELGVALHSWAGRRVLAGLEVDDHDAAVGVELEPVGVPEEGDLLAVVELDDGLEALPRWRASVRALAACQSRKRVSAGLDAVVLAVGRPRGAEVSRPHTSSTWPISGRRGRASTSPLATRWARACTSLPMFADWWAVPAPPASRLRNHWAGQVMRPARASRPRRAPGCSRVADRLDRAGRRAGAPPGGRVGLPAPAARSPTRLGGRAAASRRAAAARSGRGRRRDRRRYAAARLTSPASDSGRGGRPVDPLDRDRRARPGSATAARRRRRRRRRR